MNRNLFGLLVIVFCIALVVLTSCESRSGRMRRDDMSNGHKPKLQTLLVIQSVEIKDMHVATSLFKVKIVGSPGVYLYEDVCLFVKGDTLVQTHTFINTFVR